MKTLYIILSTCYLLSIMSCKKAWLDVRPNKAIVVPSEVKDYQSLLDNAALFNKNGSGLGEVSADNYYLLFPVWQSLGNAQERNAYIWAKDIYQGETGLDWRDAYTRILTENVVLDGIEKIKPNQIEASAWNNVKGSALFYRAYDFFNLAQEFCKPYLASTASTDLGIPLRKSSDIFINVSRSTVQETYDQIINDLMLARQLLPDVAVVKTR
ncbi:MAG: RagB/SusD family nutrient uptake outer membrane protein, partial [Flavisolibacter sp.]|nr:RagB/SusD family nutrient uptake outer membrane protein [Flavisolibacter sp.]